MYDDALSSLCALYSSRTCQTSLYNLWRASSGVLKWLLFTKNTASDWGRLKGGMKLFNTLLCSPIKAVLSNSAVACVRKCGNIISAEGCLYSSWRLLFNPAVLLPGSYTTKSSVRPFISSRIWRRITLQMWLSVAVSKGKRRGFQVFDVLMVRMRQRHTSKFFPEPK